METLAPLLHAETLLFVIFLAESRPVQNTANRPIFLHYGTQAAIPLAHVLYIREFSFPCTNESFPQMFDILSLPLLRVELLESYFVLAQTSLSSTFI